MITTANSTWDAQFKMLRQHAMSVPDTERHAAGQVIFESYPVLGYNYRMTDIQAAVGREQLKRVEDIVARRRELADEYRHLLHDVAGLRLPSEANWARSNWQSFCVGLPPECNQRAVMQQMLEAGIATRRGIMCSHREPAYRDVPVRMSLQHSEHAQDHSIILPLYVQMTSDEQRQVANALKKACYSSLTSRECAE
jgi:dTDP-4-amino-4,6-dideoxygalactose transaminase